VVLTVASGSGYQIDSPSTASGTITDDDIEPPSITSHPESTTVIAGSTTTLTVVASGTNPAYQWYKGVAGVTTTPVGTNSPSFTTPALTANVVYWVRVSNSAGISDSNSATLTVNQTPVFSGFTTSTGFNSQVTISIGKLIGRTSDSENDRVSLTSVGSTSSHGGSVVMQNSVVIYTPPLGFSGADTFVVTFTDSFGGVVVGTVTVNVGSYTGAELSNPPVLKIEDGKVHLVFQGIPGRSYEAQRSTNLGNWIAVGVATADSTGKVDFTDDSPPKGNAYYRFRKP
jgi:Cadherin-like domain/Ig-like domain CHU_C associated